MDRLSMGREYDLKNIHTLLTDGFTDQELREFCFITPSFKVVINSLSYNSSKVEIILKILGHAEKTNNFTELLDWAKGTNPRQYEDHEPYYRVIAPSNGGPSTLNIYIKVGLVIVLTITAIIIAWLFWPLNGQPPVEPTPATEVSEIDPILTSPLSPPLAPVPGSFSSVPVTQTTTVTDSTPIVPTLEIVIVITGTRQGVDDAHIELIGETIELVAKTGKEGKVTIELLPSYRDYEAVLTVTKPGFEPYEDVIDIVDGVVQIELNPLPTPTFNSRIAFESGRDGNLEIYVMSINGDGLQRLTRNEVDDSAPAWSYDGKRIAFETSEEGRQIIQMVNIDDTEVIYLTSGGVINTLPAWSPDGTRLAFVSDRDEPDSQKCGQGVENCNWDIYVVNTDGQGEVKNLTNFPSVADSFPDWSPNGQEIVFVSHRLNDNDEIFIMDAEGTNVRPLTDHPMQDTAPAWSPDGTRIVFQSNRDDNNEIYVINSDGTEQDRLTNDLASDTNPAWSPDGTRIVFQSNREGDEEIYIMNADGSGVERLTSQPPNQDPDWSIEMN